MKTIIFFIFLSFSLSGCALMYIGSPKNVPLFEEKGEGQIEAGISTNSIFATANYAFSEKYSFIINGCWSYGNFTKWKDLGALSSGGEISIFGGEGDAVHRSIEAGLGRFNLSQSNYCLEIYAGAGYGSSYDDYYECKYILGFVQSNFGKKFKRMDTGGSLRLGYSNWQSNEIIEDTGWFKIISYKGNIHLEPLIFVRVGGKHLKASFRGGFNILIPFLNQNSNITFSKYLNYHFFELPHLSAGVSYHF